MNTQILDISISIVAAAMIYAICYMVTKIILHINMQKIQEETKMLYDLLDERDEELKRYHRMFGPLKNWEDPERLKNSLFGEDDNVKCEHLTPQQIEERYNGMGPDEEELPF